MLILGILTVFKDLEVGDMGERPMVRHIIWWDKYIHEFYYWRNALQGKLRAEKVCGRGSVGHCASPSHALILHRPVSSFPVSKVGNPLAPNFHEAIRKAWNEKKVLYSTSLPHGNRSLWCRRIIEIRSVAKVVKHHTLTYLSNPY